MTLAHRKLDGLQLRGYAPHVESYFVKANDPAGERAIWLKCTAICTTAGERFAEAWAIAFRRDRGPIGARARVPFEDASFSTDDIAARVAGCELGRDRVKGSLGAGPQRVDFDLSLRDLSAPLYPLSLGLYALPVSSNKPTSPLPNARLTGTVRAYGEEWSVDAWHGMLGHNWGKSHTHSYGWAQCNAWDGDEDVMLEVSLGKPRIGPLQLPTWRMFNLRVRGVHYDLSHVKDVRRNRGDFDLRSAWFVGSNDLVTVRGELEASTAQTAGLHYENPDGSICHCLNSKLAKARVEIEIRGRAPMVLHTRRAALEIGTTDPDHGVTRIA